MAEPATLLVADDDPGLRESLERTLTREGYRVVLTAFGTVEEAVKAMKDGAYDFLTKPFRREQLIKLVDKALERRDLIEQNKALKKQLEDIRAKGQMIGSSPAYRRMLSLVE